MGFHRSYFIGLTTPVGAASEQANQYAEDEQHADAGHPGADGLVKLSVHGKAQQCEDADQADDEAHTPCLLIVKERQLGEQENAIERRSEDAHGAGEDDEYSCEDRHLRCLLLTRQFASWAAKSQNTRTSELVLAAQTEPASSSVSGGL